MHVRPRARPRSARLGAAGRRRGAVRRVLFGYANEQLDEYNRAERIGDRMRHEDNVGHKIEWENDVEMVESVTNGGAVQRALGHPLRLPDEGPPGHAQPRRLHQQPARAALRGAVPRPRRRQRRHQARRLHDGAVRRPAGSRRAASPAASRRKVGRRRGEVAGRRRAASIPTLGRVQSAVLVPPGERRTTRAGSTRTGSRQLPAPARRPRAARLLRSALRGVPPGALLLAGRQAMRRGRRAPPVMWPRRSGGPSSSVTAKTGRVAPAAAKCDRVPKGVPRIAYDDPRRRSTASSASSISTRRRS